VAVDRRFNRRRYDAIKTVETFSARLRAEVDLDTSPRSCWQWSTEPMEPTRVSLWLRPSVDRAGPVSH
jgi:predicted unusual protein kinase regulating ubiquinone biosynthesis (AarF/ABC1/UbiB family)